MEIIWLREAIVCVQYPCYLGLPFKMSLFQLMVNMLEDRDKLQDQLEQYKVTLDQRDQRIHELEKERESLKRQVDVHTQHLPQVSILNPVFRV